jgi:predicted  nucleic acid-binding Zn-ribbon protein
MEPEFLQAYRAGHKLHSLRASVSAANSKIYAREAELGNAENRIVAVELLVISSETTTDERIALLVELKELSELTGQLETEIKQLIADRARFEQDLQYYEQTVAAYGY